MQAMLTEGFPFRQLNHIVIVGRGVITSGRGACGQLEKLYLIISNF